MYRYLTFGLLTLLISTSCAVAPLEEGRKAYERGDYATAFRLMKPLAEQGDATAQYNLGYMYRMGRGVPQDYAEAAKWFRKAAEQGEAIAQNSLGVMYEKGQGVPQDYVEAVKWYRKAAEQGEATAQSNLGFMYDQGQGVAQLNLGAMYDNGQGVPQDYTEAAMLYRKAAEQGLAEPQCYLGIMYKLGQGVPQDYVLAHMWLNLAASWFPASKGKIRDMCMRNRDRVASMMTPYQIAEAERLAREWKPKKEVK
jgi:TPR repeat protein